LHGIVLRRMLFAIVDELILHYELHCKDCGVPMRLPKGMIAWLFADPDAQPNHSHAIAVVCRLCKSVDTYFLERNYPDHNPRNLVIFANPNRDTMDGPMLGCDEEGCQALVPLLAQWNRDSSTKERKADTATWRWGHLLCPLGHPIAKPHWKLL
jgi:hypothetical protein